MCPKIKLQQFFGTVNFVNYINDDITGHELYYCNVNIIAHQSNTCSISDLD